MAFKHFIANDFVEGLFWSGTAIAVIVGVWQIGFSHPVSLVIVLGVTIFLWRIICEGIVVVFAIHDVLTSISKDLRVLTERLPSGSTASGEAGVVPGAQNTLLPPPGGNAGTE